MDVLRTKLQEELDTVDWRALRTQAARDSVILVAPELDLVAVAPGGELAAFCVCGFADPERKIGYTDPIGTHPRYQRLGLAKALVSAGLIGLRKAGAQAAELGTSSENGALQKLAAALGFVCSAEKVWFSKVVA